MATLQVRDVSDATMAELKVRADKVGVSLSAFVRQLLDDAATEPSMDEVLARIATREPVNVSDEETIAAIREGRRW